MPDTSIVERDEIKALRHWMAVWNRVCDAADPDDEKDPPPWEVVREVVAPDYDPKAFQSADYFGGYMRQTLIYLVEELLYALPDPALTPSEEK